MQIAYFDEVKYHAGRQPYFWFGCILVPESRISELEERMADLSQRCFGESTLGHATEFHASQIFQGKGNFKGVAPLDRLNVLKELVDILCLYDDVGRIFVRLDPSKIMTAVDLERLAFVYLVEKVQVELRARGDTGMLIGDRDNAKLSTVYAKDLSRYRAATTPYTYGITLTHLVDTVHFSDSHLSRMLQLADLYVYMKQLCQRKPARFPGDELVRYATSDTSFSYSNRYKIWPR